MIFSYCPQCKSSDIEYDQVKRYHCRHCDYTYYHNPAPAAAGIIIHNRKLLLIKRARDPGKGKLDLPGGFVDPGESAEDAMQREVMEELGVRVSSVRYFSSFPNTYEYKGILYTTCDLVFEIKINMFPEKWDISEIQEILLVSPESIYDCEFAFTSIRNAVIRYFKNNRTG